jgi:hypothetical protein
MNEKLPGQPSARVSAFLEKVQANRRGRIVFVVDATGSRERAWDMASREQAQMFSEAAGLGTLDVQLVYFRGLAGYGGECKASRWTGDPQDLARAMARVTCQTGHTQIQRALEHVCKEHQAQPVNAVVYVGDMCEEPAQALYDATASISGVPLFIFQEGDDPSAAVIFQEMARLSRGAYFAFRPGASDQLRDLLRAVAAFATGGLTALADLRTDSARKLLGQLK